MTTETETTATERVLAALKDVRPSGDGWVALCPAHDDHNPSLSITPTDDRVLLRCHADCSFTAVLAAAGLRKSDLFDHPRTGGKSKGRTQIGPEGEPEWFPSGFTFVDHYNYVSPSNMLVFQALRGTDDKGVKQFRQRSPDRDKYGGWNWKTKGIPEIERVIPYFLPELLTAVAAGETIWITEGEKDAEALAGIGVRTTCNAGGAGKWFPLHATYLTGAAAVVIVADKDQPGYKHAAAVATTLRNVGVTDIRVVEAHATVTGKGADAADHLAAGFGLDDFADVELSSSTTVDEEDEDFVATDDTQGSERDAGKSTKQRTIVAANDAVDFSDAVISESVVQTTLEGSWLWTGGLGWLRWAGVVWEDVEDVEIVEHVRLWVRAKAAKVTASPKSSPLRVNSAAKMLQKNRILGIAELTRGQVLADLADFDQDPDILVCANGVVDLRTGLLMPHDSTRLVIRCTPVVYHPEATHPDWETALEAVPAAVRDWLQIRFGQAVTGHVPDDDRMVLLQGGGENGKSTVLAAVMQALGTYAGMVPDKVLLSSPGDHSTEMMTLRGKRMAVIEETPEARHLDTNRLKKMLGTAIITAREVYKNNTSFKPTHGLFVSSNYRPLIEESDTGTWRRLALMVFPFHYCREGVAPVAATDRVGDPLLRTRVLEEAQQQAVLTWLVEGARMWYAAEQVMPPLPGAVIDDTLSWRVETDSVLAYIQERLIADPEAHLPAKDLTLDFGHYLMDRGQHAWSDRTLATRFSGHEWAAAHRIEKRKTRAGKPGCSRAQHRAASMGDTPFFHAWFGVRFRTPADELREAPKEPGVPAVPAVPGENKLSYTRTLRKVPNDPAQLAQNTNPQVSALIVPDAPAAATGWDDF